MLPGRSLITSIYKSEGTVHARGNKPFMLSYFPLVLCLRKNIRAVHAQHEGVVYSFVNLEISENYYKKEMEDSVCA